MQRHFFSFDRGIVVGGCFVLWIGAAGLICWALVPKQLQDNQETVAAPAVVHVESTAIGAASAPISVAQR